MTSHRLPLSPVLALALLGGCGQSPIEGDTDILGPFSGAPRRFVIDRLDMPVGSMQFAADLDGDGRPDNKYGGIIQALQGVQNDAVAAVPGMLGTGTLAPEIEIVSDDSALLADGSVGVRWAGAPGESGDTVGGTLAAGAFVSNRTRTTRHPATVIVHLPVFADADPIAVTVTGVEIDLTRDGAGFRGELHGGIHEPIVERTYHAFLSMMSARPEEHRILRQVLDTTPADGTISLAEFRDNALITNIMAVDVRLFDAQGRWAPSPTRPKDSLSLGFGFHAVPCDAGSCRAQAAPRCDDRVRNGDETDVDCGGSCHPCASARACKAGADCQSDACTASRCAPSTCGNGLRDGHETDVDCGGYCPSWCGLGQACATHRDCASGRCTGGRCVKTS